MIKICELERELTDVEVQELEKVFGGGGTDSLFGISSSSTLSNSLGLGSYNPSYPNVGSGQSLFMQSGKGFDRFNTAAILPVTYNRGAGVGISNGTPIGMSVSDGKGNVGTVIQGGTLAYQNKDGWSAMVTPGGFQFGVPIK